MSLSAKDIARKLHADLKSGKLAKIGIEEIVAAVVAAGCEANHRMVEQVTRQVVEQAS